MDFEHSLTHIAPLLNKITYFGAAPQLLYQIFPNLNGQAQLARVQGHGHPRDKRR